MEWIAQEEVSIPLLWPINKIMTPKKNKKGIKCINIYSAQSYIILLYNQVFKDSKIFFKSKFNNSICIDVS